MECWGHVFHSDSEAWMILKFYLCSDYKLFKKSFKCKHWSFVKAFKRNNWAHSVDAIVNGNVNF